MIEISDSIPDHKHLLPLFSESCNFFDLLTGQTIAKPAASADFIGYAIHDRL